MAKRFGRNQRRKLMAQAAERNYYAVMLDKERARTSALKRRIEDWDARIRQEMGEYSAFLSEPGRVEVRRFFERIPIYTPVYFMPGTDSLDHTTSTLDHITIGLFRVLCDEDVIALRKNIRFVQVNPGREKVLAAYSMSDLGAYKYDRPFLARFIAEEITSFLTRKPDAPAR
jgi:hypothetical protein